jgi:hypothetical protein
VAGGVWPHQRFHAGAYSEWIPCTMGQTCSALSGRFSGRSEYCCHNGLCTGKVKRWRLGCEQASDLVYARGAGPEKLQRGDRDRVRRLERNSGGKKGLL